MPITATSGFYDTSLDTSGWLTSTGTTGAITWTDTRPIGTATLGTAYFDTETSGFQIYDGDRSGGNNGWVTVDSSGTLGVQGNVVAGDTVTVQYTSDGVSITNPYVMVESAESKEARIKRQLREMMKANLLIRMGTRQKTLKPRVNPQEIKARNTLRDLISEKEWRRYLTNGFVIIPALSGKCYQVFNDQRHIKVYVKGKLTDEICIHTDASECPPTDHILNMMVLIQNDEQLIWTKGIGNVYNKDGSLQGNLIYENNANTVMYGELGAFVASGEDVPVEFIGHRKLNLVENYKQLKSA